MTLHDIMTNYSPQRVVPYCQRYDARTIMRATDAMTLAKLSDTYAPSDAEKLVVYHLSVLSAYLGLGVKPTSEQLTECAQLIVSRARWMTLPQLMLFFYRMRTGEIAQQHPSCRMQVSFSPIAMLSALRVFSSEISDCKAKANANAQVIVDIDDLCNHEQYIWLTHQAGEGDVEAKQLLMPPEARLPQYRALTFQTYLSHLQKL